MTLSIQDAADLSAAGAMTDEEIQDRFHSDLQTAMSRGEKAWDGTEAKVGLRLLDRPITVVDLDAGTYDIWMEDGRDICIQATPSRGVRSFQDFELARVQWNAVLRRVFSDVPGVEAWGEYFGPHVKGSSRPRRSDLEDKGRDIFQVRLIGLWQRPRAVDAVIDAVKLYDAILCRREVPVG